MSFDTQREQALAILARTGIWPSNYAPPALHLLWRLGLAILEKLIMFGSTAGATALVYGQVR